MEHGYAPNCFHLWLEHQCEAGPGELFEPSVGGDYSQPPFDLLRSCLLEPHHLP